MPPALHRIHRFSPGSKVKEYGNLRFDVLQSVDDPTNFLLIEVYRPEAFLLSYLHWAFGIMENKMEMENQMETSV